MENTLEVENKLKRDIYGSFTLGKAEFAISVKFIQEVVNEPEHYNAMPLAPDYLMGLFNLRGTIIPVVDLRKLFDLGSDSQEAQKNRKIAIIQHGQFCVGFLFDTTGEVFNGNNEVKRTFKSQGTEARKSAISGVFNLDQGKRIIQIFEPHKIVDFNQLPEAQDAVARHAKKIKSGTRKQCISFTVGESLCAMNISAIQEIIKLETIEKSVSFGEKSLGVINLRGKAVPLVDFSALLGYDEEPNPDALIDQDYKVIVMRIEGDLVGLLVNAVESIVSYYPEDLIPFPVFGAKNKNLFEGCIATDHSIQTILLNQNAISSNSEINAIIQGHITTYKSSGTTAAAVAQKTVKKTYITFSIKSRYAIEITEIDEVVGYPEHLLPTLGLSDNYKGMINLRGDLVPVIDPRALYNMNDNSVSDTSKILVFKMDDAKYGLIVDSVDSIMSFSENSRTRIPEIMYRGKDVPFLEDVKAAFQIELEQNAFTTFLILNLASIMSRVNDNQ